MELELLTEILATYGWAGLCVFLVADRAIKDYKSPSYVNPRRDFVTEIESLRNDLNTLTVRVAIIEQVSEQLRNIKKQTT